MRNLNSRSVKAIAVAALTSLVIIGFQYCGKGFQSLEYTEGSSQSGSTGGTTPPLTPLPPAPVDCPATMIVLEGACISIYQPIAGSLRALAQSKGRLFGTAVDSVALATAGEPLYRQIASEQFSLVTPENEMKWDALRPTQATYNFTSADAIVRNAVRYGQKVRGHALVWHQQNPAWLTTGNFTPAQKVVLLEEHIATTIAHFQSKFPGQVTIWDVANESFQDATGALRTTLWSDIGTAPDDYVRIAFRAAAKADPTAILAYNDFSNENIGPKSDAIFAWIQKLKAEGVPIHAVGFEVHLSTEYGSPPIAELQANIRRYAGIGVAVHMTEADVRTNIGDGLSALEQQRQTEAYTNLLSVCMTEPNCKVFTLWGFTEGRSWIPSAFPGFAATLPWNASYNTTPTYQLIRTYLTN